MVSVQALIDAFRLPPQALVSQRIPKKMLVEQGAPTAADKRLINDTVAERWWHAALKPGIIGMPAFHADASIGSERGGGVRSGAVPETEGAQTAADVIGLALASVQLRQDSRDAQAQRLRQLIDRAIQYPVLWVASASASNPAGVVVSPARKRASLGEAGKQAGAAHELET